MTLEAIAQEFGVHRERIRQIEAKALRKCRRALSKGFTSNAPIAFHDLVDEDPEPWAFVRGRGRVRRAPSLDNYDEGKVWTPRRSRVVLGYAEPCHFSFERGKL